MKKVLSIFVVLVLLIGGLVIFFNPFKAPGGSNKIEIAIINSSHDDAAALQLQDGGFIRDYNAFVIALSIKNKRDKIQPGGYYLSKNMDAWQVIDKITNGPDLKWVVIPEGIRKEQIGERLKDALGWRDQELDKWNKIDTTKNPDYFEGVYFPDTYLLPVKDDGSQIAERIILHFNEKFAPFSKKFAEKNIKWTTAVKIASIVQREAGSSTDMPLIAGVLWNRLSAGQKLDIDATVQYAKGKTDGKWWPTVTGHDIQNIDSPYNTYKNSGLPPHPISNPGIAAINAVLNPENTDCLYYLHDHDRQIHCAKTYEEHLKNIDKYLN